MTKQLMVPDFTRDSLAESLRAGFPCQECPKLKAEIEENEGVIKLLRRQRDSVLSLLDKAQLACSQQAEDEGLWFEAQTVTEVYLQAALRKLHAIIEDTEP